MYLFFRHSLIVVRCHSHLKSVLLLELICELCCLDCLLLLNVIVYVLGLGLIAVGFVTILVVLLIGGLVIWVWFVFDC